MFDAWQNLLRWLDSPAADYIVDNLSDGTATVNELAEVLEDFNIPATQRNMRRLLAECAFEDSQLAA